MSKTQPYSEYREVSLPWLSKIPLNWDIKRAKFVFNPIDIRSETGNEEILSVSANDGVVPRSQKNVTMFMAESYVGHKLCWEDDLVINSLWAWAKGLGFSKQHGLVSSAYGVYRLKQPYKAYAKYLHYALRSLVYDWEFRIRSKGIWTSRLQLTDDAFFDMPILLPPLEEQKKIVSFIQQQDRRIRKFIRNKKALLRIIEDRRRAEIVALLTNGSTSVPKSISQSTLFSTPCWSVKRAKFLFDAIDVRSTTGSEELLTVSAIDGVVPRSQKDVTMFMAQSYVGHKLCWQGDLVVNSLWAWAKGLGFSGHHGLVSSAYGVYRLKPQYREYAGYLHHALRSLIYDWEFRVRSKGIWTSRLQLTDDSFFNIPIALPPLSDALRVCEQIEGIERRLKEQRNLIDRQIAAVSEYQARLVTDAVTGKIDLLNYQPSTEPETAEAEPDRSFDDSDELNEEHSGDEELLAEVVNAD